MHTDGVVLFGATGDLARKKIFPAIYNMERRGLFGSAPVVGVAGLDDSGINIGVGPWARVSDFGPAGDQVHRAVLAAMRRRGIVIAVPRREVTMMEKAA